MSTYTTQNFEDGTSGGLKDKLFLAERYIYGSSRLGLEAVDKLMALKQSDLTELDMSSVVQDYLTPLAAGTWRFTSALGNHPTMYESLDYNGDGKMDMKINSIAGSAPFSSHLQFDVVPGETYTLEYDIMDINIPFLYTYTVPSTAVPAYYNETQSLNVGHYAVNFTVPTNGSPAMKLKFYAGNNGNAGGYVVYGNIKVTGAGNPFNKELAPALPVEQEELIVGDKRYELSNHLGNVLAVVTDRKIPLDATGTTYSADVIQYTDYTPFGVELDQRHGQEDQRYRYSFQGQETDKEIKGEGNSVNYKYRMHDPRIGRFFAVDPLAHQYSYNSPYAFSENIVIHGIELEGREVYYDPAGNFVASIGTSLQPRQLQTFRAVDDVLHAKYKETHGLMDIYKQHYEYDLRIASQYSKPVDITKMYPVSAAYQRRYTLPEEPPADNLANKKVFDVKNYPISMPKAKKNYQQQQADKAYNSGDVWGWFTWNVKETEMLWNREEDGYIYFAQDFSKGVNVVGAVFTLGGTGYATFGGYLMTGSDAIDSFVDFGTGNPDAMSNTLWRFSLNQVGAKFDDFSDDVFKLNEQISVPMNLNNQQTINFIENTPQMGVPQKLINATVNAGLATSIVFLSKHLRYTEDCLKSIS